MGLFDGTSGSTTTSVPGWAQPYYEGYLGRAQEVSDLPYQGFSGQRYAGMNEAQQQALQATQQRALNGSDVMNTAQQALQGTAGGAGLGAVAAQNPYLSAQNQQAGAINPYLGAQNQQAGAQNPYLTAQNQYAQADNPYLQQSIDAASQDVLRNYNLAVRPQLDAMDARSGSFGNSGVQQMALEQQRQLGQTLGNMSSGMRQADYNQRAALSENAVNRLYQGGAQQQQNQFTAGSQLAQNQFSGGQQQAQNIYNSGAQLASQQFQGGQAGAASQNALYDAERSRQMQALGLAPTFAANDYTDAAKLFGVGSTMQADQQQGLDWQYQQYQNAQAYPQQQLAVLGNALGMNFGNTTTTTQGSPSTASNAMSGAILGGMMGGSGAGNNTGTWLGALAGLLGG